MEHLFDKLEKYNELDYYPYHMPGHKRRLSGAMPKDVMEMDITEIDGFDNLHQPEEILKQLQQEAAALFGAKKSYYLVNGSTSGILTAISSVFLQEGHLLIARNCHRSVYHAAYLRNLKLSYLYPAVVEGYSICEAITPEQVEEALEKDPEIGAVVIVSPTYEGRIAKVKQIAEIVHKHGIPLIVDEAHGAHLGFHKKMVKNSCSLGADIVIHSVHKTLPAMTQTALLHINGDLVDCRRVERFLKIYQSSSPSYVLMAGIDNALTMVKETGEKLFEAFINNWEYMMQQLSACKVLEIFPWQKEKQDIGKLVIGVQKTGLSGRQFYDILLQEYFLQLEMAQGSYVLAMFTIGDTKEGFRRMVKALLELDKKFASQKEEEEKNNISQQKNILQQKDILQRNILQKDISQKDISKKDIFPKKGIPLSQAWDMVSEDLPIEKCSGRLAGDFINCYPPGIPIIVPGEVLTPEILDTIAEEKKLGITLQGIKLENNSLKIPVILE